MLQFLGIVIGIISGITWEYLSTTPFKNAPTLIQSLVFSKSTSSIHLHHWLIYLLLATSIGVIALKYNRISHPAILFLLFFFISAIIFNFFKYPDWHQFIK